MSSASSPPRSAPPRARPIQFTPFTKKDFATDEGVAFVNNTLAQIFTTVNALFGAGGPTLLPSGVDVQGATVTGLAAPSSPSDAVSAAHADSNYSAAAQRPQLDLGGTQTLKGLAYLYQWQQQNQGGVAAALAALAKGVSGTVSLAKLTPTGTDGSLTVAGGIITSITNPT